MIGVQLSYPEQAQDPDAAQKLWDRCLAKWREKGDSFMELDTILQYAYHDAESFKLSDDLRDRLFQLLKGSARRPTQTTLYNKLGHGLAMWKVLGWARRIHVHFDEQGQVTMVDYTGGQSYPEDIARTRQDILRM